MDREHLHSSPARQREDAARKDQERQRDRDQQRRRPQTPCGTGRASAGRARAAARRTIIASVIALPAIADRIDTSLIAPNGAATSFARARAQAVEIRLARIADTHVVRDPLLGQRDQPATAGCPTAGGRSGSRRPAAPCRTARSTARSADRPAPTRVSPSSPDANNCRASPTIIATVSRRRASPATAGRGARNGSSPSGGSDGRRSSCGAGVIEERRAARIGRR